MSRKRELTSNPCRLALCGMAVAIATVIVVPMWAAAEESSPHKTHAMPSGSMDHSKMGGMKMDGMSMTGDPDYDFATNMRMHHKMGIDMAEAEVKNGKDPKMQQMAKDIITAQKKEIAELDAWLSTHGKATDAAPLKQK